eukprot:scaffold5362_cov67-Phaeocystis_antarctica.AAC.4
MIDVWRRTIFSEREASPLAPWRIVLVTRRTPIRQLATRQRYSAVRRRHLIGANANARPQVSAPQPPRTPFALHSSTLAACVMCEEHPFKFNSRD